MGKKRSKDAIIYRILECCGKGDAAKTNIVYQCNMNFNTVEPYLELLTREELIEPLSFKDNVIRYKTTQKGFEAIEMLKTLSNILGIEA